MMTITEDGQVSTEKIVITLGKLKELNACTKGIEWFERAKRHDVRGICYDLVDDNYANWANWLLTRLMIKKQRVQYAVFAAQQVLHVFEERYPGDNRPRKAIEAALTYIKDPSYAASSAYAAAYAAASSAYAASSTYAAAYAAAYAAYAAAYAASDAAYDAADAAAYAASDAADAASSAYAASSADAAYAAAAKKETQLKIIDYGVSLLEDI